MPYLTANEIRTHYWQVGSGPDLVMLHGLGGNMAVWHLSAVTKLRPHFRVTTYDLRGHGRTDMPMEGYTTAEMSQDLRGLIETLDLKNPVLLGHSFGADIVLHYGLRYAQDVAGLIVIDAMMPAMLTQYKREDFPGWAYWATMIEELTGEPVPKEKWMDIEYMLTRSFDIPILFGPFRGRPRNRVPITSLLTETSILSDFDDPGDLVPENLSGIAAPTLLMYEENSPFSESYQVLQARLPDAHSVFLPESDVQHFSPLQQGDLIADHVLDFLKPERIGPGEDGTDTRAHDKKIQDTEAQDTETHEAVDTPQAAQR